VGDVEGMARAGVAILSDATRWRTMSDAAAADARERFSEAALDTQYEALYERAVALRPRPPRAARAAPTPALPMPAVVGAAGVGSGPANG
jgi:hypothetical protein